MQEQSQKHKEESKEPGRPPSRKSTTKPGSTPKRAVSITKQASPVNSTKNYTYWRKDALSRSSCGGSGETAERDNLQQPLFAFMRLPVIHAVIHI